MPHVHCFQLVLVELTQQIAGSLKFTLSVAILESFIHLVSVHKVCTLCIFDKLWVDLLEAVGDEQHNNAIREKTRVNLCKL